MDSITMAVLAEEAVRPLAVGDMVVHAERTARVQEVCADGWLILRGIGLDTTANWWGQLWVADAAQVRRGF